jgi:hypothetical protein
MSNQEITELLKKGAYIKVFKILDKLDLSV